MTGSQTLLARGALSVAAGAVSVGAAAWERRSILSRTRFDRLLYVTYLVTRLGLFALVFLLLRIPPRGDITAYYYPQALLAAHGAVPYRDFVSSYAPLHSYGDSLLLRVWNSPLAIILFATLAEFASLPLWLSVGRSLRPEPEVRTAALLYLFSPLSLQFCTLDGQDNVLIALLLAAGLWLLIRRRDLLAGALFGLSLLAVKIIPLLYAPVLWAGASRRWRWLAGAAAVTLLGYGVFAALRAPILMPLLYEGELKSAGDLPYVFEAITGLTVAGWVWTALLLAVLLVVLLRAMRAVFRATAMPARLGAMLFGMSCLTLTLELFSKKSWPPYLMLLLFGFLLTVAQGREWRRRAVLLAGFSTVALVEHSYWASMLGQFRAPVFHRGLVAGDPRCFAFLFLEFALLAGYAWLLYLAWAAIEPPPAAPPDAQRSEPRQPIGLRGRQAQS